MTSLQLIELPDSAPNYVAAPPRRFRPFWIFCFAKNSSDSPIFIYGPRHESATTTIPTSLYLLEPGQHTPAFWDCKGILIPQGRCVQVGRRTATGPVALKYRDMRRVRVSGNGDALFCSSPNQLLGPEQDHFPVPNLTSDQILALPRRLVRVS